MIVAAVSSEPTTEVECARREWVRPSLQILAAGSAENQLGPATDNISNPS